MLPRPGKVRQINRPRLPICWKFAADSSTIMANPYTLELVQALPTSGARAAAAFTIGNRQFLAIPQLAEDIPGAPRGMNLGNSDVQLIIYHMNKDYHFEECQRLPVPGGEDAEFFSIEGRHFLATASLRSGKGPYNLEDIVSVIFEWQDEKFIPFQTIPTFAAKQWRYFTFADRHFLALAQGVTVPGLQSKIPPESVIFEWDRSTNAFHHFQTVPSAWGYNWLHFSLAGHEFLAYADHKMPSIILRWEEGHFNHFQTLGDESTLGRAFCFIETKDEALLAFANIGGDSLIYYWDGTEFQIRQRLEEPGGREWALFRQGDETFVAHIRFITGTPHAPHTALQSSIYRIEAGQLVPIASFPTLGGTDVTAITVNGEIWLVACESLDKDQQFRVDSHIYRFKSPVSGPKDVRGDTVYQNPEFLSLFETYTASQSSLGTQLANIMSSKTASYPLLAATSSSLIFYPGDGRDPSCISFRRSNRGFKELAAISHLGPALASLVQMYEAAPEDQTWRSEAKRLLEATNKTRRANSAELWRDKIQVEAFKGREATIATMIDYSCAVTVEFLQIVINDPTKLTPEFLQMEYLEARGAFLHATVPFNAVMIATFFLVGLDLAYRMKHWLKDYNIEWTKAMVVVVGRQGRETSGVTLTTNSVAQVILESSGLQLPPQRLYIAPHGPNINIEKSDDIEFIRQYERPLRLLWNRNQAVGALGPTMFSGYPAYKPQASRPVVTNATSELSEMPLIKSPNDWMSLTTRMRLVLEDARQLLSGCVTDYAAQQLRLNNYNTATVVVPGLDNFDYPNKPKTPIYPCISAEDTVNQMGALNLTVSPVPIETEFEFSFQKCITADGEIAFWEEGEGSQTIIWIHGLPLASQSWGAQRQYFRKNYHNIYMDLRGYGESSKLPANVEDVTELYCNDLRTLMDHLKLERANIVGFASAGHVALRFAAQNPGRVVRLVTINGTPIFRQKSDWPWGFSDDAINQFISSADNDGIDGITSMILDPAVVFRDLSRDDAEKVVSWFRQMSVKAGIQTLFGFFKHISLDDDRHLMSSIVAPTLLISGSLGQEVPSQSGLYLRQEIKRAQLVEIPDADHFSFITKPIIINPLIDGFLSRGSIENGNH